MDLPELVQGRLEGERAVARVSLGGDDAVVVTPSRTLVYRAEGLLSDESVAAYPHDVERISLRSGRRKSTFELAYVDGEKDFTVPSGTAHDVLVPLLTGALRTAGVVDGDESVRNAYRFSDLTLVVTDARAVKHVGSAVWDEDFEVAPYADLTGLRFEEGAVATEMVLEVDGYPHRLKVPNEHAGIVRKTVQEAVFAFHDVSSSAELHDAVAEDEEEEEDVLERSGFTQLLGDDGDEDPEVAGASASAGAEGVAGEAAASENGGDRAPEPAVGTDVVDGVGEIGETTRASGADGDASADAVPAAVAERLAELTATVERQNELLERQGETIQRLVEELRRGR